MCYTVAVVTSTCESTFNADLRHRIKMNFIAQVEEHLRDLGAEARKKHPGVKEASERAILQLRTLQNAYVTAVRHATKTGGPHPTTALFRSQDLLRPFLLAANYPNASLKLLDISFKAMRLLIEGHAICPGDGIHLVRVWTIQAQVCVSQHKNSNPLHFYSSTAATTNPPNMSSSSSSWFSGFSLSGGGSGSAPASSEVGVVSSSSGQGGHHSKKEHDRLSVEILACLVMLLELRELPVSEEQWSGSVALCCILLSVGDASSTSILPQAAKSTLRGVLSLLYERNGKLPVATATWVDLLNLATFKKSSEITFKGAFSNCSLTKGPVPPHPDVCLELLHEILTHTPELFEAGSEDVFLSTAGKLKQLLLTRDFGTLWRCIRVVGTLIQTQHNEWKPACRELLLELVSAVSVATEECRNHEDFEDGYVFEVMDNVKDGRGSRRGSNAGIETTALVPDIILWKAALALEVIHKLLSEYEEVIVEGEGSLVAIVTEAVSDFATIAASCKQNILQIVACAIRFDTDDPNDTIEPTIFHRAEEGGKLLESGASVEVVKNTSSNASESAATNRSLPLPHCEIGEPAWVAFHCILSVCRLLEDLLDDDKDDEGPDKNSRTLISLMEGSFAPSLAVLQHYLKRFPGSRVISQCALAGYANLADVSLTHGSAPQRKALLSSLCKLSLPMWGKYDAASFLQDSHTKSLQCLLGIIQKNYNAVLSEWAVVMCTLEELSTLIISSPKLSDDGYRAALTVSRIYARIAPLSACLSIESLLLLIEALADASRASVEMRHDGLSDGDFVLPAIEKQPPSLAPRIESETDPFTERRDSKDFDSRNPSISGKLMSFAGRAITAGLGAPACEVGMDESNYPEKPIPLDQRTKKKYHDDYRNEFAKRLSNSKRTTSNDVFEHLPFAVVALTDVAMSNSFRFESCFALITKRFCSLAELSTAMRVYTMDVVAMLIISQISEEGSIPSSSKGPHVMAKKRQDDKDYWVVEEVGSFQESHYTCENELKGLSRATLLDPLCECIRTTECADVAEAGISALHSILEGAGHDLSGEAWTVIICAVSSLSGDGAICSNPFTNRSAVEFSACSVFAFRCLKLIVDDYLNQLPNPSEPSAKGARTALLDCCSSFGSSRHDLNISLTAIGLLWTIADQDPDPKSIDYALSKLVFLSSDSRAEVRNCSVNTFFSCVAGRGQQLSVKQWKSIFTETIFDIFDRVFPPGEDDSFAMSNGEGSSRRGNRDQPASRYMVSVHHSRDSKGKQWATTQVMALRGLNRVLRNFFQNLLSTVENGNSDEDKQTPWFPSSWKWILGIALDSATQLGGIDTLELRKAGVDLLILCSQLSSRDGIGAAISPARVGTNMEVVNGALRTVRDSNIKTQTKQYKGQESSKATNLWRERMFLESFNMLDELGHHFRNIVNDQEGKSIYIESSQLQVMQNLSIGLGKLYECCKDEELLPASHSQSTFSRALVDGTFEDRFVEIVATVAQKAVGDPGSKFLTQAQRASLDLLRTMTSNASPAAFKGLALMAGQSFMWVSSNELEGHVGFTVLGEEATKVVADHMLSEKLSKETKVHVLHDLLALIAEAHERDLDGMTSMNRRPGYDLFVPVMQGGLRAATLMEENETTRRQVDDLWKMVLRVLTIMLSSLTTSCQHTTDTDNMLKILAAARANVPSRQTSGFCDVLVDGASNSLGVLQKLPKDKKTVSSRQAVSIEFADNVLKAFEVCFSLATEVESRSTGLLSVAGDALQGAVEAFKQEQDMLLDSHPSVKIALIVCKAIQAYPQLGSLVVAVFPLLCKLVCANHVVLREEVGKVLSGIDLQRILGEAEERTRIAEERTLAAQKQIDSLERELHCVREENEKLQQQVSVFSAELPYI